MASRALIEQMVQTLAEVYGRRSEDLSLLISIWEKATERLSDEQLRLGFQNLMETEQRSKMPVPADLFGAMYAGIEEDAMLAWNRLFQALRANAGRSLEFEDNVIAEVARQLGGIDFLSRLPERDLQWQRKPFIETYLILAKRADNYDPLCETEHMGRPIVIKSVSARKKI